MIAPGTTGRFEAVRQATAGTPKNPCFADSPAHCPGATGSASLRLFQRNQVELVTQRVQLGFERVADLVRLGSPAVVSGLLQTEGYTRAILSAAPGATEPVADERTAVRMERQRRVLMRDDPPTVWFLVDVTSGSRAAVAPSRPPERLAKPPVTARARGSACIRHGGASRVRPRFRLRSRTWTVDFSA